MPAGFGWAYIPTSAAAMELPSIGKQLAFWPVQAVGQAARGLETGGGGGKTGVWIADLGDSSTQALSALGTPIASGQGVAQALGDGVLVDGVGDVDVLASVHTALHIVAHVLLQLAEQQAKEASQQGAAQV